MALAAEVADRIIRGLIVTAFENDEAMEKLLRQHQPYVERIVRESMTHFGNELRRLGSLAGIVTDRPFKPWERTPQEQIEDLLRSNNSYLERARRAETQAETNRKALARAHQKIADARAVLLGNAKAMYHEEE